MSETQRAATALGDDARRAAEAELGPLADALTDTFAEVGRSITRELDEAARRGRLTMAGLVDDVLADLARLAAEDLVRAPIERALGGVVGTAFGTDQRFDRSRAQEASRALGAASRGTRNG